MESISLFSYIVAIDIYSTGNQSWTWIPFHYYWYFKQLRIDLFWTKICSYALMPLAVARYTVCLLCQESRNQTIPRGSGSET